MEDKKEISESERLALKLFNAEKRKVVRENKKNARIAEDRLSAFPQTQALLRYAKDYREKDKKSIDVYARATKRAWDNVSREAWDTAWIARNKAGQVLLDFILSPVCSELDD